MGGTVCSFCLHGSLCVQGSGPALAACISNPMLGFGATKVLVVPRWFAMSLPSAVSATKDAATFSTQAVSCCMRFGFVHDTGRLPFCAIGTFGAPVAAGIAVSISALAPTRKFVPPTLRAARVRLSSPSIVGASPGPVSQGPGLRNLGFAAAIDAAEGAPTSFLVSSSLTAVNAASRCAWSAPRGLLGQHRP